MRTLLLTRGAPGAGKSTWIDEMGLRGYALCPDELRKLCASDELMPDGSFRITQEQENEKKVWEVLFSVLEHRMSRGEFTVIDATCSKTKDMQKYKDLADRYRYRVYCVDFTGVPLDVCLERNRMRDEEKRVPDAAIKNIYARFATQPVPGRITVIKPDGFDEVLEKPLDVSEYRKLVFIGDIHGCYATLMQYPDFRLGLKDDTEYIFCGDYIDRGNQNAEVMKFMNSIMDLPNVCILEGNHERHLQAYGNGEISKSQEFEGKTKALLKEGGYDEKMARMFYRKVRQFSHLLFHGTEILACHGGIPNLNTNLLYIPSSKFIKGVGKYADYIENAESWMVQTAPNCYLVHGHRNTQGSELRMADRVFNLEGRVEFGGNLRIVECSYDGDKVVWNEVELPDCQPIDENLNTEERAIKGVGDAIAYLRHNRFVSEKDLGDGISSFNFTREAFQKGNWTKQTVLARGLFVDTVNEKIMARSYEKFFRIGETHETELAALKTSLKFPVTAYVKENGFLAIVSYDYNKDDLFVASKSTNKGDYVNYINKQLSPFRKNLLRFLKNCYEEDGIELSLVFECVDRENDPHIIEYGQSGLFLLDAIPNELSYSHLSYEELQAIVGAVGCRIKEKAYVLTDWNDFLKLYNEVQDIDYKYSGKYIEGFVFVDSSGFMTKCKTAYYNEWKKLRGLSDQVLRCGYTLKTGSLQDELENRFYGFCRDLHRDYYDKANKDYPFPVDIISLRKRFEAE